MVLAQLLAGGMQNAEQLDVAIRDFSTPLIVELSRWKPNALGWRRVFQS
jgi:hypothetical protein